MPTTVIVQTWKLRRRSCFRFKDLAACHANSGMSFTNKCCIMILLRHYFKREYYRLDLIHSVRCDWTHSTHWCVCALHFSLVPFQQSCFFVYVLSFQCLSPHQPCTYLSLSRSLQRVATILVYKYHCFCHHIPSLLPFGSFVVSHSLVKSDSRWVCLRNKSPTLRPLPIDFG